MESFTFVKLEDYNDSIDDTLTILSSQLLACRVCLETESKLFDLHLYGLADIFGELTGTQVSRTDGLPQYICSICYVQLRKSSAFRAKCRQVHVLMQDARVRQPLMTTSHLRTLDRSLLKQQFSFTNELIISIPAETYTNEHKQIQMDVNLDFQKAFIDKIEENASVIKRESSEYYDYIILSSESESTDQFDADITLDYPETSQTIESIDEAKDTVINDLNNINNHEVLEQINAEDANAELVTERATKKKTALKKNNELKKKVKDKLIKRSFNVKLVEDIAEFNQMYNWKEGIRKEEQLKEVEERKDSTAFINSQFQCVICCKGFMNNVAYEKHMIIHNKVNNT